MSVHTANVSSASASAPQERAPEKRIIPITLRVANDFVERFHRHSSRTNNDGGKFAIGFESGGQLVGVAIVGRPVSRMLQHGKEEFPAELLRLCTSPQAPHGAGSKLYSRAKHIWQMMGGSHFHTYTLVRESGDTMRAVGFKDCDATPVKAERWHRDNRPRTAKAIEEEPKLRWSEGLALIPLSDGAPTRQDDTSEPNGTNP